MTMLIIEINNPKKTPNELAPKIANPQELNSTTQPPAQKEIPYAEKKDYDQLLAVWRPVLEKAEVTVDISKGTGRVHHMRFSGILAGELDNFLLKPQGFVRQDPTEQQLRSSGQFEILSYKWNNVLYTFVLRGKKTAQAHVAAGAASDLILNRKDLTPTALGLAGLKFNNKKELYDKIKHSLAIKLGRSPKLLLACGQYVDIAYAGGKGKIDNESLEYIKPVLGMIAQDFGELLAPLVLAGPNDQIDFPSGNEKLIDVQIGKSRYSVKALGGSGTSMNSLGTLLDEYEMTLTDAGKKKMFQDTIKIWRSTRKEGSVVDRICLAGNINQSPEYLTYSKLLKGDFTSFAELKILLTKAVSKMPYEKFLKFILPAMQSGAWGTPVGLPDDGRYYLGQTDKKPKPGQAGKASYDADPVNGAANIITYSIGIGLRNLIDRGPSAQQYKEILSDMLRTMDVRLGHVTLSQDGGLVVAQKPFADLEFKFDYHAPSHMAGNNRPGFAIVPPK